MTAQDILQKLAQEHGQLTPEIVIDYASPQDSPLHKFFQWDDSKAAELYRLEQARGLIRRIKVEYVTEETKTVTVRAYHCIAPEIPMIDEDGEEQTNRGVYVPLETAMSDYRSQLMAQCKRDMDGFKRKYAALKEVASVIDAMDAVA
jgi:hypothetical protein